jgi:hypothetical protein
MIDLAQLHRAAGAAQLGAVIEVTEAWLRQVIAEIERGRGEPDYVTRVQLDHGEVKRLGPR